MEPKNNFQLTYDVEAVIDDIYRCLETHVKSEFLLSNESNELTKEPTPDLILVRAKLSCLGLVQVELVVDFERIDPVSNLWQVRYYSFNAAIQNVGNICRYDSAPHHDHRDEHHKHEFDWRTGEELPKSPRWIGKDSAKTVCEMMDELSKWYYDNMIELSQDYAVINHNGR